MRKLKLFSLLFIFVGAITLVACQTSASGQEAYVTVDINPSVELIVTPNEKVVYANALNADAELLLAGLNLIGLDLDEALDLLIEEAIYLEFIDIESEEINVSIQTMANTDDIQERIHERAKEHVNKAFENRAMVGRAVDKVFNNEFVQEAHDLGVTPGFLMMVNSVLLSQDAYTFEELLELDQQELIKILREQHAENKIIMSTLRADFFEAREAIRAEYQPQIEPLELEIEALEVEIEAKVAEIDAVNVALEAEDADIATLEAELETLQAELEALDLDLAALEANLQVIKDEMHAEIAIIRTEFVEQTKLMAQQMGLMHQQKRALNRERIEAFLDRAEERRESMREKMEEFQNRRP